MSFDFSSLAHSDAGLLKLLTLNLPDMLWIKDLDGKYIYANKAICDGLLMAKDIEEPIGKDDVFFALREREAHKDKPDWHTFGELCFNSDIVVIENNRAMKFEEYGNVKGKLLYLEVNKAPFYDDKGNIIGTVGSGRDITELKLTQIKLKQQYETIKEQSRMVSMGEMIASIAHQWSNHYPLFQLFQQVCYFKKKMIILQMIFLKSLVRLLTIMLNTFQKQLMTLETL